MKKLFIPALALTLLGAGCFGGVRTDSGGLTGEGGTDSSDVQRDATVDGVPIIQDQGAQFSGNSGLGPDVRDIQQLAIDIGLLIVEAGNAGIDATELEAWSNEAAAASEALREEDYDEARTQMQALKVEIQAAIDAAQ